MSCLKPDIVVSLLITTTSIPIIAAQSHIYPAVRPYVNAVWRAPSARTFGISFSI